MIPLHKVPIQKNQKFWGIVLDFVVLKQMSFGFDSANTMVVGCVLVLAIVVRALTSLVPVI